MKRRNFIFDISTATSALYFEGIFAKNEKQLAFSFYETSENNWMTQDQGHHQIEHFLNQKYKSRS